jgi:HEAT repeat protein
MSRTPLADIANPETRLQELEYRIEHDEGRSLLEALLGRLDDPRPEIRQTATATLQDRVGDTVAGIAAALLHQPPEEIERILSMFNLEVDLQPNPLVRQAACTILQNHGSDESRQALVLAANDESADVRFRALLSLSRRPDAGGEELERVAASRLQDSDEEVAGVAAELLAREGLVDYADGIAAVWKRIEAPGAHLQFAIALAELHGDHGAELDREVLEAVAERLTDALGDEETGTAAIRSLVDLGPEYAIGPLRNLLDRWFVHPLLRVEAAAGLVELDDARGFEEIEDALGHRRKDARGYAIRAVGRHGIDAHLQELVEVANGDGYHNETALLALVEWGSPEALDTAESIREGHASPEMRLLAERALELRNEHGRFNAEMIDFPAGP